MILVSLDIGARRIGAAMSHGVVAEEYGIFDLKKKSFEDFIVWLGNIISEQKVEKIIIGLPLRKNSTATGESEKILAVGKKIKSTFGEKVGVEYTNEAFSSSQARLESFGEGKIDAKSARIILEQYLNEKRN